MQREQTGLARIPLFSYGFRPFFLGGAIWAALAMILWIGELSGAWGVAQSYGWVAWHAHAMLFGYVSAIMAGFLLTAIPNWTGRLPVRGGPLMALFLLWLAGRAALIFVDQIGLVPAVTIDASFLVVLALVILREIVAGKNWRNLKTVLLVSLLALANIGFHWEVLRAGAPDISIRAAVAAIIGLIMLIGGRITPSFTRNWLVRQGAKRLPVPFGRFDKAALAVSGFALALWFVLPDAEATGIVMLLAMAFQAARLWRWAGVLTWREPLVLVLHIGYLFVPIGFGLVGVSILWPAIIPATDASHAWMAGAVAIMTIAVMTRATLGHTGRSLTAGARTRLIYGAIALAVFCRLAAPFVPDAMMVLLSIAGVCWIIGFGVFALDYGQMLLRPRLAS